MYVTTNGGKKLIMCSSYWHDGEVTAYPWNYVGDRFTEALANHEQPKSDWIKFLVNFFVHMVILSVTISNQGSD